MAGGGDLGSPGPSRRACLFLKDIVNGAIRDGRLECGVLDPRFNRVGSQISEQELREGDAWIYHLTGYLSLDKRCRFAAELARRFGAEPRSSLEEGLPRAGDVGRWSSPVVGRSVGASGREQARRDR